MISYADVEKAYRLERVNPTLQKLPDGFYEEARLLADSPGVGEYRGIIMEYIGKIHYHRSNKVIHYAGRAEANSKPPDNIMRQEMRLYKEILDAIAENRAMVLERRVHEPEAEKARETVKVKLKQALQAFTGPDMREYGPYREDDVVEMPKDIAALLVEGKAAENA